MKSLQTDQEIQDPLNWAMAAACARETSLREAAENMAAAIGGTSDALLNPVVLPSVTDDFVTTAPAIQEPTQLVAPASPDSPSMNGSSAPLMAARANGAAMDVGQRTYVEFPLCDAAVQKGEGSGWELADAILAECSKPGKNGVRNASHAKLKAMQEEIARNVGVHISLDRARELRSVAATFPPARRRPGVSLEGHLEANTPEALDELINGAPKGTALTRNYIRNMKPPAKTPKQNTSKEERDRQVADQRKALEGICRQYERQIDQLEERYISVCRSVGKEPELLPPPPASEEGPSRTVAENLAGHCLRLPINRVFNQAPIIRRSHTKTK